MISLPPLDAPASGFLKMKKFGPYKILKKYDSGNAYEVELPDGIQISPIFNITDLK